MWWARLSMAMGTGRGLAAGSFVRIPSVAGKPRGNHPSVGGELEPVNADGRELLTWALAKVAAAGRVVALHVTTADGLGTDERSIASADSLALRASAWPAGSCESSTYGLEPRCAIVSGFSKNFLQIILQDDGMVNPEAIMKEAIAGNEYQKLAVFD